MALEAFRLLPAIHSLLFGKNSSDGEAQIIKSTDEAIHINASPFIVSITPSNATVYSPSLVGFRVGGAGDVAVRSNGINVTITNVQVGEQIAGNVDMVYSTGTTATSLTGWKR